MSAVSTWRSPVLLIHADDDEKIVIPDHAHHFMLHVNRAHVNAAVAAFFERKFPAGPRGCGGRQQR